MVLNLYTLYLSTWIVSNTIGIFALSLSKDIGVAILNTHHRRTRTAGAEVTALISLAACNVTQLSGLRELVRFRTVTDITFIRPCSRLADEH